MEDGELLRKYLINDNNLSCEFSFGNNILWNPGERLEYQIVEDVLIYRMIYEEEIVYCTPDFKDRVQEFLDFVETDSKQTGKSFLISCLNEKMTEEIKAVSGNKYKFETNRAQSDYIYLVDSLAGLSGRKLHKKKNHLNYFLKNYEFTYEEINKNNAKECKDMKNRWMAGKEEVRGSLLVESGAIDTALDYFETFGFLGGLIRINGEVKAFTLGERLSRDTFVTHFEKAEENMNGLYTAINQQFAKNTLSGKYTYVNREDDMGLEGLRQAKLSYYPEMVYDKYVARLTEN